MRRRGRLPKLKPEGVHAPSIRPDQAGTPPGRLCMPKAFEPLAGPPVFIAGVARSGTTWVQRLLATHPGEGSAIAKKYLRYGSSPRGAQSIVRASKILALMKGRYNVAFSDLKEAAFPALRHRMILNFEAEAENVTGDKVVKDIIAAVPQTTE